VAPSRPVASPPVTTPLVTETMSSGWDPAPAGRRASASGGGKITCTGCFSPMPADAPKCSVCGKANVRKVVAADTARRASASGPAPYLISPRSAAAAVVSSPKVPSYSAARGTPVSSPTPAPVSSPTPAPVSSPSPAKPAAAAGPKLCPECGSNFPPSAKFCGECGYKP